MTDNTTLTAKEMWEICMDKRLFYGALQRFLDKVLLLHITKEKQ
jgi:hypothetical protein